MSGAGFQPARRFSTGASRQQMNRLILAALCLPSLLFIAINRDVPHFGILEDDGIYLIGAKSIAEGHGYHILNLRDEPYQTKYPPLYPAYLSIAWKLASTLQQRITLALFLSWLAFPVCVFLFHIWLRRRDFGERESLLITALFALNPYILFFNANLGSETQFLALLFVTILLAERDRALPAGLIAGLGYLSRTASAPLLPAAILYYLWKRQPKNAALFAIGMLPAVIAWTLWSRAHQAPGHDIITRVYTNYLGYYLDNVSLSNVHLVIWKNVSALLESFGSYVFPQMIGGILAKFILQPLGLAMILGIIRMGRTSLYSLFGVFASAMLLLWNFTPNQRFVLPLAPLLLAGFWVEAKHFATLVRAALHHKDRGQRVVAWGFTSFLILILAAGAGLQVYMWFRILPEQARDDRANDQQFAKLYDWIRQNTTPETSVIWENATALYLSTDRHSAAFLMPTRHWYEEEDESKYYKQLDDYARSQGYELIMLPEIGPHRDEDVLKSAAGNKELKRIHEETGGVVYRVYIAGFMGWERTIDHAAGVASAVASAAPIRRLFLN
jgi:hypothetical protein